MQAIFKFVHHFKKNLPLCGRDTSIVLLKALLDRIENKRTTLSDLVNLLNNSTQCTKFAIMTANEYLETDQNNRINLTKKFYTDFNISEEDFENINIVNLATIEPKKQTVVDLTTPRSNPTLVIGDDEGNLQEIVLARPDQVEQKIELINNSKALETLTTTLLATADKKAQNRKAAPKQKAVQDNSTNPVIVGLELFDELYRGKFPELPPPKHSVKDRTNFKELADHFGGKVLSDTIQWFFKNYDDLKKKYNWTYPSVGLFYGFRNSIFPLAIKNEKVDNNVKWGSHHKEDNDRDDGDEVGFGIKLDDDDN
jgi:hypothetical protein